MPVHIANAAAATAAVGGCARRDHAAQSRAQHRPDLDGYKQREFRGAYGRA